MTAGTAFDAAVRRLARRAHTERELVDELTSLGHSREEVEAAVARARELHLMEPEAEIAARLAQGLATKAGATPPWVRAKLAARGLPDAAISAAIDEAFATWDALESARRLIASETNRDRAARRLQRRGYAADVIRRAIPAPWETPDEGA